MIAAFKHNVGKRIIFQSSTKEDDVDLSHVAVKKGLRDNVRAVEKKEKLFREDVPRSRGSVPCAKPNNKYNKIKKKEKKGGSCSR